MLSKVFIERPKTWMISRWYITPNSSILFGTWNSRNFISFNSSCHLVNNPHRRYDEIAKQTSWQFFPGPIVLSPHAALIIRLLIQPMLTEHAQLPCTVGGGEGRKVSENRESVPVLMKYMVWQRIWTLNKGSHKLLQLWKVQQGNSEG